MDPRTFLGGARLAVAASALLAPALAARAFGVDPQRSDPWLTRLFGSRELVLSGLLLTAPDRARERDVARIGALVDGIDVASSVVDYRAGRMSRWTAVSGGAGAALFTLLGVLIARDA